ncbi:hypothetical protein FHX36_003715 [Modestobacter versicolor]|uniref:DUF5667 domain-containing protein n=1 Tax=Modestobacter versicolor TaxID=429133 RepID=A0A839Y208_9ACTN|nr:hypothetical protein [Modestobacter versicolor]
MTLHDDAPGPARRGAGDPADAEAALVARLRALSSEHAVDPDEEFRAATRARLVAMAAVRTPATGSARRPTAPTGALRRFLAGGADPRPSPWRTRLTAGLTGAALTVTALGGLLAAAQGARPGDLLYDLKRGGEQTQLALAGDSQRGLTLLDFASTRLDELEELVGVQPGADAVVGTTPSGGEAGLAAGPDVDLVLDTLQTMDEQTSEGTAELTARAVEESDPGALETLTGWAAEQQDGLAGVAGAVPTGAQGALAGSQELVGRVAARGAELRTAFGCPGGPAVEGADDLGPLPAACPAAPPAPAGTPAPSSSSTPAQVPPSGAVPPVDTSAPAAGTGGPAPTTAALPSAGAPGAPTAGGLPPVPAPTSTARPGLPLPSLPLPGAPSTSAAAPSSSPGAVVSVPTLVPGVTVCLPPLVTVGC